MFECQVYQISEQYLGSFSFLVVIVLHVKMILMGLCHT